MVERTQRLLSVLGLSLMVVLLVTAMGCKKDESPRSPTDEESKSALRKAGEKTGDMARTAVEKTGEAAEVVKDKTGEAAEVVAEKTVETYEKAKEGTKDFVEGTKEGYQDKAEPSTEKPETPAATYSLVLTAAGDSKVAAIQAAREATGLGLKEATDLIAAVTPTTIKSGLSLAEAEALKTKFEKAGATVEIKSDAP